jgi:hypothetical protein
MDKVHVGTPTYNDGKQGGFQFGWMMNATDKNAYVTIPNGQRVNPSYIPPAVKKRLTDEFTARGTIPTQLELAALWDKRGRPLK